MFNEEMNDVETKTQKKMTTKEKCMNVLAVVLIIVALLSTFQCGYWVSDSTFAERNYDDYQYAKDIVNQMYNFSEYDEDMATYSAINGYLSALGDKYATYISPAEFEKMEMSSRGESLSLGFNLTLDENYNIIITGIVQGGNAVGSGIQAGDRLLSIKGQSTATLEEYQRFNAQNIFTDGEEVEVAVERNGEKLIFTIVTNKIVVPLCQLSFMDEYAYIKLTTFSETSAEQLMECVGTINDNVDCKGIILDLRDNGGGQLTAMTKIAGCFMDNKLIARFEYKNKNETYTAFKEKNYTELPLVVLVNGNTASASECLTGALQCHGRATIVGTQTFGKGIGQSTYECPSGGYITITTSKYYLPNGVWLHGVGITPDSVVELPEEIVNGSVALTQENDTQLATAKNIFKNN